MVVVVGPHTACYCKGNLAAYHNIFAARQSKPVVQQLSQNYPKNRHHRRTAYEGQMIVAQVEGWRFWVSFATTTILIAGQSQMNLQQLGVVDVLILLLDSRMSLLEEGDETVHKSSNSHRQHILDCGLLDRDAWRNFVVVEDPLDLDD